MIRLATREDKNTTAAAVKASGLFQPAELEEVLKALTENLERVDRPEGFWLIDDDNGTAVSVAYCAPEQLTDRTWNLLLIAVLPDKRGQGRGGQLLDRVENLLKEREQRLLLVETSGMETFRNTRSFYGRAGYDEEAWIRDYYGNGDDKVIFRKSLS